MRTADYALRPLTAADAPAMVALLRDAFAEHAARLDPPPSAARETAAAIAAALAEGGGAGCEIGGALAGGVLWVERAGGLYMGRLAVAPAFRGRGLARALVAAAEAEARARRLPRIHLSVRLPLTDNRRLFAACGFVETERHAHPGYATPTYVDMEKLLSP